MIAHDARAALRISLHGDAIADAEGVRRYDAVRDEASDRVVRASTSGDQLRAGRIVERASIGHLPAGFGVNHGTVEDNFARFAGLQLLHPAILGDDGVDAAVFGTRSRVKGRFGCKRLRNLRVSRIRRLFSSAALPRRAGPRPLLVHGAFKTGLVEGDSEVSGRIGDEVERQAIGVVKLESAIS